MGFCFDISALLAGVCSPNHIENPYILKWQFRAVPWEENDMWYVYNRYKQLIVSKKMTDINQIALMVPRTVPQTIIELQSIFLNKNFFCMHVDAETQTIMPGIDPNPIPILPLNLYEIMSPLFLFDNLDMNLWVDNKDRYTAYEIYRDLIRNNNFTDITQIAKTVNKSILRTQLEIQSMVYKKYIIGVHVDLKTKTIVPGDDPNPVPIIPINLFNNNSPENILCKNCGASNPFENSECEYCGSDLK